MTWPHSPGHLCSQEGTSRYALVYLNVLVALWIKGIVFLSNHLECLWFWLQFFLPVLLLHLLFNIAGLYRNDQSWEIQSELQVIDMCELLSLCQSHRATYIKLMNTLGRCLTAWNEMEKDSSCTELPTILFWAFSYSHLSILNFILIQFNSF